MRTKMMAVLVMLMLVLVGTVVAQTDRGPGPQYEYTTMDTVDAPFAADFEAQTLEGFKLVTVVLVPNGECTLNPPVPCWRSYFVRSLN